MLKYRMSNTISSNDDSLRLTDCYHLRRHACFLLWRMNWWLVCYYSEWKFMHCLITVINFSLTSRLRYVSCLRLLECGHYHALLIWLVLTPHHQFPAFMVVADLFVLFAELCFNLMMYAEFFFWSDRRFIILLDVLRFIPGNEHFRDESGRLVVCGLTPGQVGANVLVRLVMSVHSTFLLCDW